MAFKKQQPESGVVVGRREKTLATLRRKIKATTPKQRIAIAGIFVLIAILGLGALYIYGETKKPTQKTEQQKYTQEFIESDNSDATISNLVERYGSQFDDKSSKVLQSNPAEWDKAMLDDACVALLYADKMSATTQTASLLAYIESAGASGLDINNNSYGINQEIRDAIRSRTKERIQQAMEENAEDTNE